jgi:hypothetical protein
MIFRARARDGKQMIFDGSTIDNWRIFASKTTSNGVMMNEKLQHPFPDHAAVSPKSCARKMN